MSVCIDYKDTIKLVTTTDTNAYGKPVVDEVVSTKALVAMNTGTAHVANTQAVTSDAVVYIDPTDEFVSDNYYRLEEMYVVIELFSTPQAKAWYKVVGVSVARDALLCNDIDTVSLTLVKAAGLGNV